VASPVRVSRVPVALLVGLAGWLAWSPHAEAQSGDLILASTSDTGVKANQHCVAPWLSGDGTKVAFTSLATNLDPADTDANWDVYVKDLVTGDIALASTSDHGKKANSDSGRTRDPSHQNKEFMSLSADGRQVTFTSTATNLDPADHDPFEDVYVKDLVSGDITLAATSDAGVKQNGRAYDSILSADGTMVAFSSQSTNLDPADTDFQTPDVYIKDLMTGDLTLASVSATGVEVGGELAALSANGQRVLLNGVSGGVYVKNLKTGTLRLISTSDTGVKANRPGFGVSLVDGKASFYSDATNLDPADAIEDPDVYVKDLATGDLSLASTTLPTPDRPSDEFGGAMSEDGTKVVFSSYSRADPSDMDRNRDVYVRDLTTGTISLVSANKVGRSNNTSHGGFQGSIAPDGSRVAFITIATNLDPADTDDILDVYVTTIA
jgi:hypothetical protein